MNKYEKGGFVFIDAVSVMANYTDTQPIILSQTNKSRLVRVGRDKDGKVILPPPRWQHEEYEGHDDDLDASPQKN